MPHQVRDILVQTAIGFALAALFVAMLLWFNIANLGYFVTHAKSVSLAVFLLWVANGIVFACVQLALALPRDDDDDDDDEPRGGHRGGVPHRGELRPIPIRVEPPRRH